MNDRLNYRRVMYQRQRRGLYIHSRPINKAYDNILYISKIFIPFVLYSVKCRFNIFLLYIVISCFYCIFSVDTSVLFLFFKLFD